MTTTRFRLCVGFAFLFLGCLLNAQEQSPSPITSASTPTTAPPNSAVTGLGTAKTLPLWDTTNDIVSSVVSQSGSGTTAKVGVNTMTPASTLDVQGEETVRGNLNLPAIGIATATFGRRSQPITQTASAFNSGTNAAVSQNFRWQAEPAGNNTIAPSGTLNLQFASGSNSPKETGLRIASNGQITFAKGQVFPGTGTISGVTAGTGLIGGGTTGAPTLSLDTTIVPQLAISNNFLGNQSVTGNVGVTGSVGAGTTAPGTTLDVFSSTAGIHAPIARFGSNTATDSNSILIYNGTGTAEVFQSGCANCFIPGTQAGDSGLRVTTGSIFFGSSVKSLFRIDASGISQPRTAGGAVKAMVIVRPDLNTGVDVIFRCFNSTLAANAESVKPCNFTLDKVGVGDYIINFGFAVADRFLSATPAATGNTISVCTSEFDHCPNISTTDPNEAEVTSFKNGSFADTDFYLLVY